MVLTGLKERTRRADPDGRRYGATLLSVFAVVFLVLVLPWWLTLSAEIAMRSSAAPTETTPGSQGQTYTTGANRTGLTWVDFTDGPLSTVMATVLHDCVPFDSKTIGGVPASTDAYPPQEIASYYQWVEPANGTGKTYVNIGSYHRDDHVPYTDPLAAFNMCSTMNDEIGLKFNSTLGPFKVDQGLAMTRFNMSFVAFNCGSFTCPVASNTTYTIQSNYTWRIEINGETMFGGSVGPTDPETFSRTYCYVNCTTAGLQAGLARYYPTIQFHHNLTLEETYRTRNALQAQTPYSLDVRFLWTCDVAISTPGTWGAVHCGGLETALGDLVTNHFTMDADLWVYAEVEYVEADDWATGIKLSMLISGGVMIFLALGSTPLYNPTVKILRGFNK